MTELIPPADIAGRICAAGTCERKAPKVPRVAQAAVSLAPVQNLPAFSYTYCYSYSGMRRDTGFWTRPTGAKRENTNC